MTEEGLFQIPRDERLDPSELEGYESRHEPEPDYSEVRLELRAFVQDYGRDQDLKRIGEQGRHKIPGEGVVQDAQRFGMEPTEFSIQQIRSRVKGSVMH
jgi:hypothetical protein